MLIFDSSSQGEFKRSLLLIGSHIESTLAANLFLFI